MKRMMLLLCLSCCSLFGIQAQYLPDTLGGDYLFRTINMADDYDGEVVCTLIKKPALPGVKQAVLYVHGYNDYFFQRALGDSIQAWGYNFYAIDLRKYGRSLLPHQDAFFCKNLSEYFADIDTALVMIRSEGNEKIYLMAHSTGGLISPLYLESKQKQQQFPIEGLILNSPFLDMNMSWFMEHIAIPIVSFIGKLFPRLTVMGHGPTVYAESLLKQHKGEWEFDTAWKVSNGHPKKAGWLKAIHQGHNRVQKGMDLPCPILLMSSDNSVIERNGWDDAYLTSDIVLNVADIQKYGARLGSQVTPTQIPGGMHDLILSPKPSRDQTYHTIFDWLSHH